jgi:hypothetical protein
MAENKPDWYECVSVNDRPVRKVTHEDQNVLDFIPPAFALLFIFPHTQLSHCRPVSILCGLSLDTPASTVDMIYK